MHSGFSGREVCVFGRASLGLGWGLVSAQSLQKRVLKVQVCGWLGFRV